MEPSFALLQSVASHWFATAPDAIRPLDRAGWSGAAVYAVVAGDGRFILKRCGAASVRSRVEWVHALLMHCRAAGVAAVPEVVRGRDGGTLALDAAGDVWELLECLPGGPADAPAPAQREAAAETLASIHATLASFPGDLPRLAESAGVARRRIQAAALRERPWEAWPVREVAAGLVERLRRAAAIMATAGGRRVIDRIAAFDPGPVLVQPVLRDIWSEHVLFSGGRVTGVVDWLAAGIDTPATDIARLTGSWPEPTLHRGLFLEAYSRRRPLADEAQALVGFLDAAGVVCAIDNWFRWTVEERRMFADMNRVLERIDRLLARLPDAIAEIVRGA